MPDLQSLITRIATHNQIQLTRGEDGQSILVPKDQLIMLMQVLKDDFKYTLLADLTATDYSDYYEMVYHVMNLEADLLCLKVKLSKDDPRISSLTSVWKAADVQEREIYDLMGIVFSGHGNLKRILCPDDFAGHPLRKDFKLDSVSRF